MQPFSLRQEGRGVGGGGPVEPGGLGGIAPSTPSHCLCGTRLHGSEVARNPQPGIRTADLEERRPKSEEGQVERQRPPVAGSPHPPCACPGGGGGAAEVEWVFLRLHRLHQVEGLTHTCLSFPACKSGTILLVCRRPDE